MNNDKKMWMVIGLGIAVVLLAVGAFVSNRLYYGHADPLNNGKLDPLPTKH